MLLGKKIYAVRVGRNTGIFQTWDECREQVDGFPGASYKGFSTTEEAMEFLRSSGANCGGIASGKRVPPVRSAILDTSSIPLVAGTVVAYTDGSCLKNPDGPGGYAAILALDGNTEEIVGSEASTTNNRMELSAALAALSFLKQPTKIVLHTDSQYLRRGFADGWVNKWKKNGWKTANKGPVANQDLWMELDRLVSLHSVTWQWVKGHNGNPLNERCDVLAVNAAKAKAREIGFWR